mgnify:CR=1 FL=1
MEALVKNPWQDGEALISKLGDDYERRKKMYEKDVTFNKNNYERTNINTPAFQTNLSKEADRRQKNKNRPNAYYEVNDGGDIFARRPSSAQVRAQRKQVYKDALEAQMASRKRNDTGYRSSGL